MFIYNVTIKVDWYIHKEWLQWMTQEHIPGMLATGHFKNHQLVRLVEVEEADGPTYAIQYYANSKHDYERYARTSSKQLNEIALRKWGNRFVMFETLMEVVK
jgi:hypothetical protein